MVSVFGKFDELNFIGIRAILIKHIQSIYPICNWNSLDVFIYLYTYGIYIFSTCFIWFWLISSSNLLFLRVTDRRDDKVIESNKRFTTTSRLQLSPTPEEDYVEYSCQAKHKALQPDMPMRATVQLSVLCKYTFSNSSNSCCISFF